MNQISRPTTSPNPGGATSNGAARLQWIRALGRSTASIDRSGITPRLALQSLLLTLLTFGVANTWLLWRVEQTYQGAALAWLETVPPDERIERICELVRAKRSLKSHSLLQSVFQSDAPLSQQLGQLIHGIASSPDGDEARQTRIRSWVLGDMAGWRFLVLSAAPISGSELIDRVERDDAAWKHKLDGQKDQSVDLREFLVGFADLVIQHTRPALRNLQRINGWIQWWTVYVTWIVMVAAAQRARLLARLNDRCWFAPRPAVAPGTSRPSHDGAANAAEFLEQRHWPDLLDRQVYGPYSFLLGLLPSLGFIGTVYGMGDALLSADNLFQARDKGAAISAITTHLGFAFDTTLVALLAGIVASAIVVRLRVWENHLWQMAASPKSTQSA